MNYVKWVGCFQDLVYKMIRLGRARLELLKYYHNGIHWDLELKYIELTKKLIESALILAQDFFGSIGMFQGEESDVKDYLKRQKCGYDGNTF